MSKHSAVEGIVAEAGQAAAAAVASVLRAALPAIQAKVSSSSRDAVLSQLFGPPVGLVSSPDPASPVPADPPPPAPEQPPVAVTVGPPLPPDLVPTAPAPGPAPLPWEDPKSVDAQPAAPAAPAVPAAPAASGTVPTTGMLNKGNLRSLENWRAWLHQITPVVVSVFVALGLTTQDLALLWVSLFFAVVDPLLSYTNSTDKVRRIAYGVLGAFQSGGLLVALLGGTSTALPIASAVVTIVSSALARFHTPTTTIVPATPDVT